ncbi:MAG: hypothetical protein WDO18_20665 [Acidobacteriota bacterium]
MKFPEYRQATGQLGYAYASTFTFQRFQSAWRNCVQDLLEVPAPHRVPTECGSRVLTHLSGTTSQG